MNKVNLVKNLNLLNVLNQQLSISDNLVVNAALDIGANSRQWKEESEVVPM